MGVSEIEIIRQEPQWLRVSIHHTRPVELSSLSNSLWSLAAFHNRYAARMGLTIGDDPVRLYVREIRSGSIIVDLIAQAQNFALFADTAKSILDFSTTFIGALKFLKGGGDQPEGLKTADAENIKGFLEPIARDLGATFHIGSNQGSIQVNNYFGNSADSNVIQNRASRWIEEQRAPARGIHTGCLFYFFQARDMLGSRTGDMGIIERISTRPVKTLIEGEDLKASMLNEALFRTAYVVTVRVETIEDRPRLYTILEVTESFPRD